MLPRSRVRSLLALPLLLGVVLGLAVLPRAAAAHPLGNFTINRYSRIEAGGHQVRIFYVLDMAEIPAFQESQIIDRNGDGKLDDAERSAYLAAKLPTLIANLHLAMNGETAALTSTASSLSFLPGQGGLTTLRLTMTLETPVPAGASGTLDATYRDDNFPDRLGWKEIIVRSAAGAAIDRSTVSRQDVSHELRTYPKDLLTSPLNVREARFSFTPGATVSNADDSNTTPGSIRRSGLITRTVSAADNAFTDLVKTRNLTLPVVTFLLLAAMALGAIHGLSPGHGKAIAGAYLVSSRASGKHAFFLGLTVTATHTSSVFLLGLITLTGSQFIVPERLYPVLTLSSGLIIVLMGAVLTITRGRRFLGRSVWHLRTPQPDGSAAAPAELALAGAGVAPAMRVSLAGATLVAPAGSPQPHHAHREHDHPHHEQHEHDHDNFELDGHDELGGHDQHGHSHLPPGADGRPVTWRSLLALGISGGLLPCPSAIIVLLGAIAAHRLAFGLVLIVAFSVGLAGALAGIGMLLVYSRHLFNRVNMEGRIMQALPVCSAILITLLGLAISATALGVRGLPNF